MLKINLEGVRQTKAALEVYTEDVKEAAREAARETAEYGRDVARQNTPVDTGRLKASIEVIDLGNGNYAFGTDVEYAPHQEYGTANGVVGQHMLQKGADAASVRMAENVKDVLTSL